MTLTFSHFFKKKRSYQKYYKDEKLVSEVFEVFRTRDIDTYTLQEISCNTNIPQSILSKWRTRFKNDPLYRPGNFGMHRRLFTDIQEKAVAEYIRIQYLATGRLVKRKNLREIIHNLWISIEPEKRSQTNMCSRFYIISPTACWL